MSNKKNKEVEEVTHITVPPEIEKGSYSNLCITTASFSEIVLDFAVLYPMIESPTVFSRILMTPENAKRLIINLNNTLAEWERTNGPIELPEENEVNIYDNVTDRGDIS